LKHQVGWGLSMKETLKTWTGLSALLVLGVATWVPVLVMNVYYWTTRMASGYGLFPPYMGNNARMMFFAAFFGANYFITDRLLRRIESWEVIDLLWKLFVVGVVTATGSLLLKLVEDSLVTDAFYGQFLAFSAALRLYFFMAFCLGALFMYKKLILYQKTKRKVITWNVLQIVFFFAMLRLFWGQETQEWWGGQGVEAADEATLKGWFNTILIPVFLVLAFLLSVNVNWSAYLNTTQKLKSLGLITAIASIFIFYFFLFPVEAFPDESNLAELLTQRYLLAGFLFLFPVIYTLVAGLVLIFNLPTTSVFEQRSSELATIHRINQSIQSNLDAEEILRTLMDAALLTSNATGGWIETFENGDPKTSGISYLKQVGLEEIDRLRSRENISDWVVASGKYTYIRNLRKHKSFRYTRTRIKSLLALPILTSKHPVGVIYLINELPGSFEETTIRSLVSLTEQSGVSIENAEIVAQSIDLEIYREQLRVAKTFQSRILPQNLPGTAQIEFYVTAQEVEEIGGDFYDVSQRGDTFKVAIGDVSGKGTTAAFYMAETKGVFQALTQLELGTRDFVVTANNALSNCLAKDTFITMTYLQINLSSKVMEIMRAGHCPTLYYNKAYDRLVPLAGGGIGLGIVRSQRYAELLPQPEVVNFSRGDMVILFTDGIVEARNASGEEFGQKRLEDIIYRLRDAESKLIVDTLVQQVMAFNGGKVQDDYSIMAIRFL